MREPKRPSARRVDPEALAEELAEDDRTPPSSLEADDLEDALGRVLKLEERLEAWRSWSGELISLDGCSDLKARRRIADRIAEVESRYTDAANALTEIDRQRDRVERPPRHERTRLEDRPNDALLLLAWISGRFGAEGETDAAAFIARVHELEARS